MLSRRSALKAYKLNPSLDSIIRFSKNMDTSHGNMPLQPNEPSGPKKTDDFNMTELFEKLKKLEEQQRAREEAKRWRKRKAEDSLDGQPNKFRG